MTGIVKKIDAQRFGIIDGADDSKVPFIPSDVMNRHVLEPGQKVISLSVESRTRRLPRTSW